jgi:hypothetical protein
MMAMSEEAMRYLLLTLVSMCLTLDLAAAERRICLITSDTDRERTEIFLETNSDSTLHSLRLYKTLPGGTVTRDESFPAEEVIRDGVVLVERDGRRVAVLQVRGFDLRRGGDVLIDYLVNGIRNHRATFWLKLVPDDSSFHLQDSSGQRVNRIFVYGNWVPVFGLVGIRALEARYQPGPWR